MKHWICYRKLKPLIVVIKGAHSPSFQSLHLRHSSFSFSKPSVTSPTSQLILQPFFRFSYVTGFSLTSPGEPPMRESAVEDMRLGIIAAGAWVCSERPALGPNTLVVVVVVVMLILISGTLCITKFSYRLVRRDQRFFTQTQRSVVDFFFLLMWRKKTKNMCDCYIKIVMSEKWLSWTLKLSMSQRKVVAICLVQPEGSMVPLWVIHERKVGTICLND